MPYRLLQIGVAKTIPPLASLNDTFEGVSFLRSSLWPSSDTEILCYVTHLFHT